MEQKDLELGVPAAGAACELKKMQEMLVLLFPSQPLSLD